jgi:hypothetical protein
MNAEFLMYAPGGYLAVFPEGASFDGIQAIADTLKAFGAIALERHEVDIDEVTVERSVLVMRERESAATALVNAVKPALPYVAEQMTVELFFCRCGGQPRIEIQASYAPGLQPGDPEAMHSSIADQIATLPPGSVIIVDGQADFSRYFTVIRYLLKTEGVFAMDPQFALYRDPGPCLHK